MIFQIGLKPLSYLLASLQSIAPTIGLLFLAKRLKSIPDDSFESAKDAFIKIYPNYLPGGIGDYIRQKWGEF